MAAMKAMKAAKVMKAAKAMKAMKAMKVVKKAMKVMKAMKAMKKVSAGLSKRHVFAGKATKSNGGLTKDKLVKNKGGKIVSKARSAKGKSNPWIVACSAARKALKIKGFAVAKKGSPYYLKAKALYKK